MLIVQREFAHDVFSVVIGKMDDDSRIFTSGSPVEIEWGLESQDVRTLHGYVHHTEPISSQGASRDTWLRMVCIGASYVLKEKHQQVWRGARVSSIVREKADAVKFSGDVQEHRQVWESLVQDGSDWDFLVGLAQRIGWTFYADDTDLHFKDPFSNLKHQLDSASYFMTREQNQPGGDWATALHSFHAVSGDNTPDGGQKVQRHLNGVDPRTGDFFSMDTLPAFSGLGAQSTSGPLFTNYETDPVVNIGEAAAKMVGKTRANRFHIQAKAEARGNARVRPGQLIALFGLGQRHIGYWYVHGVEHELSGADYYLHLSLGRDSDFHRFGRPHMRPRTYIPARTTPYGTLIGETPPTMLVGGQWRAAYSPRSYRAG